jgi:Bacterial SH3 domain
MFSEGRLELVRLIQTVIRICFVLALACTPSPTLVADDTVTVLEKPSPLDYPSTHPIPNSVIATLAKGQRVKVKGDGYEKDFRWYEVVLSDGRRGYVIRGVNPFHLEK